MLRFRKTEPKSPPFGGIALVGEPGSGKTSIANELTELLGCERLSFAGPLKNEVAYALAGSRLGSLADEYGWANQFDRMSDPATKDEYRPLLQAWGSFRRARDADYWADKLKANMEPGNVYVIDDCRYHNEYDMLRERGFKFVYLAPGETTRPLSPEEAAHESERDWHDFACDITLTYMPGPRAQAERILRLLSVEGAQGSDYIEDALPEDTECDPDCAKDDEDCCLNQTPENCDCEVCDEDADLFAYVNVTGYFDGSRTVRFDPPYTGRITVEYDEPVVAVPV